MDILETILTNTFTLPDLKHRAAVLRQYVEAKLFGKATPGNLSQADLNWLESLPKTFLQQFSEQNFTAGFSRLAEQVNKLQPLTIYLAFEPAMEETNLIQLWLRKNLTNRVVIETKLDPALIGGAALVWNGIYRDFSVRSKIEAQKEQILEEFKKFFR